MCRHRFYNKLHIYKNLIKPKGKIHKSNNVAYCSEVLKEGT